ncbi:MAG: SDR family oxidoreductase [Verrucomicrobiota bacterium]|nr:SDR family oxidoreductase [Verrucomicrobiota bacterium]
MSNIKNSQKTRKIAVISGSTSGLGKEMSIEFAKRGWLVAGIGKTKAKVEEMASTMGEKHHIVQCDVSCDSAVKSFSNDIIEKIGAPDLLINNAAIMNFPNPLWEIPPDEFDNLTKVNINGVANMIRHFVPSMLKQQNGLIINLSSGWGRSTSPDVAPYCATKWAIEGMSAALAQELPHGMGCIALNPGVIDTDMLRKCWGNGAESYQKPQAWAKSAVPFIEQLSYKDNGKQMTAP